MQYIVLLILIFYSFSLDKRPSGNFKTFSLIFLDSKALNWILKINFVVNLEK